MSGFLKEDSTFTHVIAIDFGTTNSVGYIYKNGMICEKDQKQNVLKGDTEVYQLSDYGTGVYTVCTGQQGNPLPRNGV